MDITLVAAGTAVTLGVALLTSLTVARRRGRRWRTRLAAAAEAGERATQAGKAAVRRAEVAEAGEREAAWSARTAAGRLAAARAVVDDLETRRAREESALLAARSDLDTLRQELRASRAEGDRWRAELAAAADRVAALETDLAGTVREVARLRIELEASPASSGPPDPGGRLQAAIREADRLRDRVGALELALAAAGAAAPGDDLLHARAEAEDARALATRLEAEVERLRSERMGFGGLRPSSAPTIPLVSEAEVRSLEERLAALTAARNAEVRRLTERIAALERLLVGAEGSDARIAELEAELKQVTELLEEVRAEAAALERRLAAADRALGAARSEADTLSALTGEVEAARHRIGDLEAQIRARAGDDETSHLRTLLAAERDRNARLVRRAAMVADAEVARAVDAATRPLRDAVDRLEAELASRPTPPAPPPPVDDVALIRGIGPKIAAILAEHGITSLRQIAALTPADVARLGPLLPVYPDRITDDRWIEQARALLARP